MMANPVVVERVPQQLHLILSVSQRVEPVV